MKTIKQLTKTLTMFALLFSLNLYTQSSNNVKTKFVRVYDLEGKKISKGRITFLNDSILSIKNGKTIISIDDIGHIKTKLSVGNTVLTTSLISGTAGALIGAAISEEETKTGDGGWLFGEYEYTTGTSPGTGAAIGGGVGMLSGALIGLGGSLFKNRETFIIGGDKEKWLIFKKVFNK